LCSLKCVSPFRCSTWGMTWRFLADSRARLFHTVRCYIIMFFSFISIRSALMTFYRKSNSTWGALRRWLDFREVSTCARCPLWPVLSRFTYYCFCNSRSSELWPLAYANYYYHEIWKNHGYLQYYTRYSRLFSNQQRLAVICK